MAVMIIVLLWMARTKSERGPTIFSENQKSRNPDDIGGLQAAVLKNADATHRLWRNPG
jgi:hypothetical protein